MRRKKRKESRVVRFLARATVWLVQPLTEGRGGVRTQALPLGYVA